MKKDEVIYKIKTANADEILAHLRESSNNFFPPLIERVDIEEYSRKIFEKSTTFEAWNGNLLTGLLAAYFSKGLDRTVFVTNVSVLADSMGQGIASRLLGNCIEYAIHENYRVINLEVHKENSHAIGLYRKYNFINDGANGDYLKMKMELFA
jgi:ribosomal protein S18 acetylase RimI-like enzyme